MGKSLHTIDLKLTNTQDRLWENVIKCIPSMSDEVLAKFIAYLRLEQVIREKQNVLK